MEALLARSELSRMLPYLGAVSLSSATSSPLPYGYKQLLHLMYAETSIFVPIFLIQLCAFCMLFHFIGDCAEGFWCKSGARVRNPQDGESGLPCPPGYYCPEGRVLC